MVLIWCLKILSTYFGDRLQSDTYTQTCYRRDSGPINPSSCTVRILHCQNDIHFFFFFRSSICCGIKTFKTHLFSPSRLHGRRHWRDILTRRFTRCYDFFFTLSIPAVNYTIINYYRDLYHFPRFFFTVILTGDSGALVIVDETFNLSSANHVNALFNIKHKNVIPIILVYS